MAELTLATLAAQAFTGLVLGMILVLLAIGLSLIFGVMRIVNMRAVSFVPRTPHSHSLSMVPDEAFYHMFFSLIKIRGNIFYGPILAISARCWRRSYPS